MDYFVENFRAALVYLLDLSSKKQGEIAKMCGITPQYLTHIKKGKKDGSEEVRRQIAATLGYTYEEFLNIGKLILSGEDPGSEAGKRKFDSLNTIAGAAMNYRGEFVTVPKYRARLSGGPGSFETSDLVESNLMFRSDFLTRRGPVDKMALFEVTGESMQPFIHHGDVVLVNRDDCDIVDGKAYAFRENDMVKIKRLSRQGGQIIASSENHMMNPPYHVDQDNFDLIGRVIWVGHEVI